jgi:hypothetical protein
MNSTAVGEIVGIAVEVGATGGLAVGVGDAVDVAVAVGSGVDGEGRQAVRCVSINVKLRIVAMIIHTFSFFIVIFGWFKLPLYLMFYQT